MENEVEEKVEAVIGEVRMIDVIAGQIGEGMEGEDIRKLSFVQNHVDKI